MQVTRRMQNALIADLVEAEDDPEEAHALIHARLEDDREVSRHLARQLGFGGWVAWDEETGAHETMMALAPELQRMLSAWPLPVDGSDAGHLAQIACKDLTPTELYATLLAGPGRWRGRQVPSVKVENLAPVLAEILLRELTASITTLLERWTKWDVPRLYEKWMGEKREREERERERQLKARAERMTDVSAEERAEARAARREMWNGMSYVPPGKTH